MQKISARFGFLIAIAAAIAGVIHAQGRSAPDWTTQGADAQRSSWIAVDPWISLDAMPRFTLVWKLKAEQAGQHDAQVTYQTDQITWRADYSIAVNKDDTAADVGACSTITFRSPSAMQSSRWYIRPIGPKFVSVVECELKEQRYIWRIRVGLL